MSLIVKFVHGAEYPGCEDTAPSSIYADVTSIHFPEVPGQLQTANLWVREPVKTALVPGFCENERHVDITGPVYVMNEQGKTISVHRPLPSRTREPEFQKYAGYQPLNLEQHAGQTTTLSLARQEEAAYLAHRNSADEVLTALEYDMAAAIRRRARLVGDREMVGRLDALRIAVDA